MSIQFSQGAEITDSGVRYTVWAPGQRRVTVEIVDKGGNSVRTISLSAGPDGHFSGFDPDGKAGDRYFFHLGDGPGRPCPASRRQPAGLNGPSEVIDLSDYPWTDQNWQRPSFRDLVIYELHVGTFTPEGTFRAAIEKLPYLRDLGINAIEIMPVADFPGTRGWGYDGVRLFAPAAIYGTPADLCALVDAAHAHGLSAILDVVYNHFGPDGNFLREFSPDYFEKRHHTPWGEAINFGLAPVRDFFKQNLLMWIADYHFDAFRLDATHAIFDDSDEHILKELADLAHKYGCQIIAEDERNEGLIITDVADDGYGLDAVWADDFHHVVETTLIDASMYRGGFAGELHELTDSLEHGWVYRGQTYPSKNRPVGTPCAHLPLDRFIFCISNHDQVGNRALGERLHHMISPESYRAASTLLCFTPYTPMIYMGQEWAATSPFQYFTDHGPELGRLVEEGRRREMHQFPAFQKALKDVEVPSPQAKETFLCSKLHWEEIDRDGHRQCLRLYRDALSLRANHDAFRPRNRDQVKFAELTCGILGIRYHGEKSDWLLLCDLRGAHRGLLGDEPFCQPPAGRSWHLTLSSNAEIYGGDDTSAFDPATGQLDFQKSEVLVFQSHA